MTLVTQVGKHPGISLTDYAKLYYWQCGFPGLGKTFLDQLTRSVVPLLDTELLIFYLIYPNKTEIDTLSAAAGDFFLSHSFLGDLLEENNYFSVRVNNLGAENMKTARAKFSGSEGRCAWYGWLF